MIINLSSMQRLVIEAKCDMIVTYMEYLMDEDWIRDFDNNDSFVINQEYFDSYIAGLIRFQKLLPLR